jgi:hypothetical protein
MPCIEKNSKSGQKVRKRKDSYKLSPEEEAAFKKMHVDTLTEEEEQQLRELGTKRVEGDE